MLYHSGEHFRRKSAEQTSVSAYKLEQHQLENINVEAQFQSFLILLSRKGRRIAGIIRTSEVDGPHKPRD